MTSKLDSAGECELFEPPFEEWSHTLVANRQGRQVLFDALGSKTCSQMREAIVEAAAVHTQSLISLADELGLPLLSDVSLGTYDHEIPLILSGHQPVVYHHGLLAKARAHWALMQETSSHGIHVVIDTDCGNSGTVLYPSQSDGRIVLKKSSISTSSELVFQKHVIVDAYELEEQSRLVQRSLQELGLSESAFRFAESMELYKRLAGHGVVEAHTLVRWSQRGFIIPEVPLSSLFKSSVFRDVLRNLIGNPGEFATLYNNCLDKYRSRHGVLNKANPFPNLVICGGLQELPLWQLEDGKRSPYRVVNDDIPSFDEGIVSRGSITTLLLRAFCSDLFVHGLGGGKYDRFVDELAEALWSVRLPQFVVASGTKYIAPERVKTLAQQVKILGQRKEIVARPQCFFDCGLFSDGEIDAIAAVEKRRVLVREKLAACASSEERSPLLFELNELNNEMGTVVDRSGFGALLRNKSSLEEQLRIWQTREFPFFMVSA